MPEKYIHKVFSIMYLFPHNAGLADVGLLSELIFFIILFPTLYMWRANHVQSKLQNATLPISMIMEDSGLYRYRGFFKLNVPHYEVDKYGILRIGYPKWVKIATYINIAIFAILEIIYWFIPNPNGVDGSAVQLVIVIFLEVPAGIIFYPAMIPSVVLKADPLNYRLRWIGPTIFTIATVWVLIQTAIAYTSPYIQPFWLWPFSQMAIDLWYLAIEHHLRIKQLNKEVNHVPFNYSY